MREPSKTSAGIGALGWSLSCGVLTVPSARTIIEGSMRRLLLGTQVHIWLPHSSMLRFPGGAVGLSPGPTSLAELLSSLEFSVAMLCIV